MTRFEHDAIATDASENDTTEQTVRVTTDLT